MDQEQPAQDIQGESAEQKPQREGSEEPSCILEGNPTDSPPRTTEKLKESQDAADEQTTNILQKLNTDRSNESISQSVKPIMSMKVPSGENLKQWEEDKAGSIEPLSGARTKGKRPNLTIIKFTEEPESFNNQQEANSNKSKDSQNAEKSIVLVNQESSPLSPHKKRNLMAPNDTSARINESVDVESYSRTHTNQSQKEGFSGFKIKGTVDIKTSGFGAEVSSRPFINSSESSNKADETAKPQKEYIPANPILPKTQHPEQKQPPQCPLNDIKFIQLQKFKKFGDAPLAKMSDGYDQIGKKNMMRENRLKKEKYEQEKTAQRIRRGHNEDDENQAKMDEYTHIIQNIVYARDPKIFDTKNGFVNQRTAFMHENMLNIKQLIRTNEEKFGEKERFGAPRSPPPRRVMKTKQQMDYELSLEAKARYKLRRDEETKLIDRTDKTLLFESRFESGNLYLAQKVSDHEYNLLMQNDINTSGHTQWFYFQVKNTRKNMSVTFNIMNFTKPDSLFNYGMKVSIYSEKKANGIDPNAANQGLDAIPQPPAPGEQKDKPPAPGEGKEGQGCGWFKGGDRISYYSNGIKKDITYTSKGYFTASFTYKFTHDEDTVYFAYCCPYTYTDCMQDIYDIESDPERRKICSRKTLCKTLAGVDCDILTITEKGNFEAMQAKRAVVISARVHPGETVGSWMMRGVLLYLTDPDNEEAKMLRAKFIFKIIPMLNPDGVINGNYRCSLAGCDLNRRWKTPHKQLHPTIFYTKKLITEVHKERGLVLYCDLHGHSRKQNVFMYGCNNTRNPTECRVFPLILSKLSKFFHFGSCRFGVQKSKESTARVSVYKELKTCPNIFTMESTFSGLDFGDRKGQHMTTSDFESMGSDLCRTLLISENIHIPPELEHLYGNKDGEPTDMTSMFESELANNKKLMAAGEGDSSGGSESEPSEDNLPVNELAAVAPIVDKKDQVKLQKIIKKKAQDEKDLEKAKANRKKGDDSPTRSPKPGQRSPLKVQDQPLIKVKPVEEKKEEKKKPEMKDACTQTERSDYQRIKKQQQQARLMQEMKDQQARLRGNQQFKSPGTLVNGQVRKSPQSQTAQRELSGQYNASPNKNKRNEGYDINERHLQDMRDPKKYQLSKDKYSLFQVQNFNPAHQTAPPQVEMQSPKHGQNIDAARGSNQSGNQLSFQQKAGMNIMVNSNTTGKPGANPIIFQNPQNKNMVIQMSQLNSGIVSNGVGYNNERSQNRTSNRQGQPQIQQQPLKNQQRFKSKNEENEFHTPVQQNLKAPGSTISKAGEQIMQKNSKFQSPKKSSNTNQSLQNSANVSKNNHDLRFQQQAITSNHFGAIHMGGNMSFVKDSFLKNKNIDPASMSAPYKAVDPASMSAPAQYALRSGGQSGQNSIHSHNRNNTNFNPALMTAGNLGGPHARSEQQSLQQPQVNLQYNQYGGSQNHNLPHNRSGTGGSKGDPHSAGNSALNNKLTSNRHQVPNDTFKSYNSTQLPPGSYPSGANSNSPSQIKEQNYEKNRRGSMQRRVQNQSQIEQVNSRNYTQMDNIQLFKSPTNSKSVVGAGGGVINIPNQNSNMQGAPSSMPQGPAQLHISAIQPNAAKSFDKRDAQKLKQGQSPTGIRNRADSMHDNNLTHINEGKQKTLVFNPAGQTMQPTSQSSIPSTPRKKGDKPAIKNTVQISGQMQNSIGSVGAIGQKYIQFNPNASSSNPHIAAHQSHGFQNSAIRNAESSAQRQIQLSGGGNVQRGSHLDNQITAIDTSNQNNIVGRSRVNSLMSSDPNQLTGIKIMPGGGPQNVMQTQKVGLNNHQMQLNNTPGTKRQSQASINSGNFIIQSQQQQYQASLAADQLSPGGSSNKRPQNGHTQSNNIHNNRNVYRMKINQKSDMKVDESNNHNLIENGEGEADK